MTREGKRCEIMSLYGELIQTGEILLSHLRLQIYTRVDFPNGPVIQNPPASAGDMDLIPSLRRFHLPWGK